MKQFNSIGLMIFCQVLTGCVDPYNIPDVKSDGKYLVVDAFLDNETKQGTVVLSRTIPLDSTEVVPETGAAVFVEVKDGATTQLIHAGNGKYVLNAMDVMVGEECRLHITTADGKEYFSHYVKAKTTPPIDSITWEAGSSVLSINITTHDDTKKSLFYRWRYEETYQYTSKFKSYVFYNPATHSVMDRIISDTLDIYVCWKTSPSTNILVTTTRNLSADIVNKFPVVELTAATHKNKIKYSLLLKQYVMDEDEYNYWSQLKKNTESVGTIFDPQPSQVTGNLYCSNDPHELVLGYFSVSSVVQQRIFIAASELPYKEYVTPYDGCYADSMSVDQFNNQPQAQLLISRIVDDPPPGVLHGYTTSTSGCIDCRIYLGGVNKEPDFWQ